jgi:hypothetical protein
MMSYIEDCLLTFLQKRCEHPGEMVAADVMEGGGEPYKVAHCRRCGAVQVRTDKGPWGWRNPMPHLWRG